METRKVQVTGGSTYTVSIPKTWATNAGIEAGSEVEFHPEGESLLLSPRTDEGPTEGVLDVDGLHDDDLMRAVVTMYVSGFDVIRLAAVEVNADQRRTIRDATRGLVGLEVVEETTDSVVLRDLLDSRELSVYNAVTRMRLIALTMLDDAVTAIVENDNDLATDVIQRDDDVDRLWFMVSRVFRSTLRDPSAAAEVGLDRETCFDYHSSARQLERIADHAAKIGSLSRDLGPVPEDVAEGLIALYEDAIGIVEGAMDALLAEDGDHATELANDVLDDVLDIDEHTRAVDDKLRDLDPLEAQLLGLVVDSLSRCADYGGNVAETALQNAAPSPR